MIRYQINKNNIPLIQSTSDSILLEDVLVYWLKLNKLKYDKIIMKNGIYTIDSKGNKYAIVYIGS